MCTCVLYTHVVLLSNAFAVWCVDCSTNIQTLTKRTTVMHRSRTQSPFTMLSTHFSYCFSRFFFSSPFVRARSSVSCLLVVQNDDEWQKKRIIAIVKRQRIASFRNLFKAFRAHTRNRQKTYTYTCLVWIVWHSVYSLETS